MPVPGMSRPGKYSSRPGKYSGLPVWRRLRAVGGALRSKDCRDVGQPRAPGQLLDGYRQPAPPIGVLVRARRYIHRLCLIGNVIELCHGQGGARPGKERMGGAHEGTEVRLAVIAEQSFAAQRLQELEPIPLTRLALPSGLLWLWEQPELLLQIDVPAYPPTPQGRQVVTARNGQSQKW